MFQFLQNPGSIADKFAQTFGNALGQRSPNLGSLNQMLQMAGKPRAPKDVLGMGDIAEPSARSSNLAESLRGSSSKSPSRAEKAQQGKEAEKEHSQQIAQDSFNRMAEILKEGKLGRTSGLRSYLGGKTAEHSGEFTSLTGALEALLVDQVSRGTLSNTRFEYITKTLLPKPTDSEAEIKGKMKGIAGLLGLDASSLESKRKEPASKYEFADEDLAEHEESYTNERQEPKVLDAAAMKRIVYLAKGDKEKAREIARKMGYKVE